MSNSKLLITGATGFIGKQFVAESHKRGFQCRKVARSFAGVSSDDCIELDLHLPINWSDHLTEVDCIIHLAAKAHIFQPSSGIDYAEFYRINTLATLELAKQAAQARVKRFIFLSSIGVNGIGNTESFSIFDAPVPVEDYAVSKLEAEIGLKQISAETGMEVVIIRPPLVYGRNAPGNFGKLAKLTQKNLPLPLGAINNKRSFVALDNLVDLIITCIDHPKAANQTFLASDDHDVSTTELLQIMIRAAGKTPRLIPVPVSWLKLAGKLTGTQAVIDRLCGSLQVDIAHTRQTLGWVPPITVEEGIRRCFVKEDLC